MFGLTITGTKPYLVIALSLGMMILVSVLSAASNNATARTLGTIITEQRNALKSPQIILGDRFTTLLNDMAVNQVTNKLYVTNPQSGTVTVIDSNSG